MEPQHEVSAADISDTPPDIGAVFLQHRDVMYGVAHAMLRTDRHHSAEDAVGEVMISILKNPPRSVRNWQAFLVRAVQNKVRDLWKSSGYRHEQPVLAEGGPIEGDPLVGDDVENDTALEVIEAIDRQETVQTVREVMAELDAWGPQAAYVLWQCKALERTSQQVAAELKVSSSRVRQILSKALTKFRSLLEAKEVKL